MPRFITAIMATAALIGLAIPSFAQTTAMNNPGQSIAYEAASSPSVDKLTQFRVDYTGSLFILPLGKLSVAGSVNNVGYAMRADMDTTGLGRIAKSQGLWSTTNGYYSAAGLRPIQHVIQKLNKKGRNVTINYDAQNNPTASIEPRFGSMGVPPANDEERREAVDAMSGIMQMMMTGHVFGQKACEGTVKIFDGKQRYNLRLVADGNKTINQGSYKGETVRCNVFMDTVSGYDPEDLLTEEEASTPLQVYLANYKDAGLYIPVRFDYRVSGIKVNIKATDIDIKTTQG